jgi:hypothetical protein
LAAVCSPPQVDEFVSYGGEFGGQPTAFATLLGQLLHPDSLLPEAAPVGLVVDLARVGVGRGGMFWVQALARKTAN